MINDWEQIHKEQMRKIVEHNHALIKENAAMKKVLVEIANDYVELSHDKARMQNIDHIKWAKAVLEEIK